MNLSITNMILIGIILITFFINCYLFLLLLCSYMISFGLWLLLINFSGLDWVTIEWRMWVLMEKGIFRSRSGRFLKIGQIIGFNGIRSKKWKYSNNGFDPSFTFYVDFWPKRTNFPYPTIDTIVLKKQSAQFVILKWNLKELYFGREILEKKAISSLLQLFWGSYFLLCFIEIFLLLSYVG